jgi:hypothetical protein
MMIYPVEWFDQVVFHLNDERLIEPTQCKYLLKDTH